MNNLFDAVASAIPGGVTFDELSESLADRYLVCEYKECQKEATFEYVKADEDGDVYATYRCSSHPLADYEYDQRELHGQRSFYTLEDY